MGVILVAGIPARTALLRWFTAVWLWHAPLPLIAPGPLNCCLLHVVWCSLLAVTATRPANPAVQQLVQELLPQLLGGAADVAAYAQAYSSRHSSSSSLRHRTAAAEMAALLDPATKLQGIQALLAAVQPAAAAETPDLAACIEVHKLLLSGPLADAAAAAEFKQSCAELFVRSGYFGGAAATSASQLVEQLADRLSAVQLAA